MIKFDMTLSQQAEFGMPVSGNGLVAAVRALPTTGAAVSAPAADRKRCTDVTTVGGYTHIADVAVQGAFPGTRVWSPPI
jgi:hypothetical protein